MTNPQKGIWSFYNSRHDQSTKGIDPMNNISNNNKNTLCSYIILTITLSTKSEPAKTNKVYLLEKLHTTSKDEDKFLVLVEIFHIENFMKKVDFR
jgi:hypothetical protein